MIACGIAIKGSEAILTILKKDRRGICDITGDFKKLKLEKDDECKDVRSFYETLKSHFLSMNPDWTEIISELDPLTTGKQLKPELVYKMYIDSCCNMTDLFPNHH